MALPLASLPCRSPFALGRRRGHFYTKHAAPPPRANPLRSCRAGRSRFRRSHALGGAASRSRGRRAVAIYPSVDGRSRSHVLSHGSRSPRIVRTLSRAQGRLARAARLPARRSPHHPRRHPWRSPAPLRTLPQLPLLPGPCAPKGSGPSAHRRTLSRGRPPGDVSVVLRGPQGRPSSAVKGGAGEWATAAMPGRWGYRRAGLDSRRRGGHAPGPSPSRGRGLAGALGADERTCARGRYRRAGERRAIERPEGVSGEGRGRRRRSASAAKQLRARPLGQ